MQANEAENPPFPAGFFVRQAQFANCGMCHGRGRKMP
jgi:hypothetical protein